MNAVKRQTSKQERWKSWAGSLDDLKSLSRVMEENVERRKQDLIRGLNEEIRISEEKFEKSKYAGGINIALEELEGERHTVEVAQVEVKILDGPDSSEGPPGELLDEIDKRTVEEVAFSGDFGWKDGEVRLTLARRSQQGTTPGVELAVSAPDQGWARQTFAHLAEEIEKGVPYWGAVRGRGVVTVAAALFVTVTLCLVLYAVLKNIPSGGEGGLQVSSLSFSILLSLGISAALFALASIFRNELFEYFFPSFELTGDDGGTSGTRRRAFVIANAASFLGGLLVNFIP